MPSSVSPTEENVQPSNANYQAAIALARSGYPIFPANLDKSPAIKNWPERATTDTKKIEDWWETNPNYTLAMPTGERSGVSVLDIDVGADKNGYSELKKLGIDPRELSPLSCNTPSGGLHVYLRHLPGLKNSASRIAPGVDVRAERGYVIGPGAVTKQDRYQASVNDIANDRIGIPLPEWPEILLSKPQQSATTDEQADFDIEMVRSALMDIPNDGSIPENANRSWWIDILASVRHATSGSSEGLELVQTWSALWAGYDPQKTEEAWNSLTRDGGEVHTAASLYHEAKKYGWSDLSPYDEFQEESEDETPGDTFGSIRLLTPDQCADLPPQEYVVKGFISPGDVGCIFGDPGAGKSLGSPHIGYAVAQGHHVFGMKSKAGAVIYIAAEDERGMRMRVSALRKQHGEADNFKLAIGVPDLFAPGSPNLKHLQKVVKDKAPSLIYIDTLAMAFPGLEENSNESMARVVAIGRQLAKRGAAVIFVYHGTKADGTTPRGHSVLNGALDMALHIKSKDKNGVIRGRLTKNRNGSIDQDITFKIGVEDVGRDVDGDPVTTAYAIELDPLLAPNIIDLSPSERIILEAFGQLAVSTETVPEDRLIEACFDNPPFSQASTRENKNVRLTDQFENSWKREN